MSAALPPPAAPRRARLPLRWALLIFAVAVGAHLWILELPFQLDDYVVLEDPLRLFDMRAAFAEQDIPAFMLRWPLWGLWALIDALTGEPLSPLPFHCVGLALHGLVAVLLGRLVTRYGAELGLARAGIVAGLGFALAGGHLQAVSWAAAWSDLLLTLFALLALELFLAARDVEGGAALRRRLFAGLFVYATLVSKAPGLVAVAAAAFVLLASGLRGRSRALLPEGAVVLVALAGALISRRLFLGSAAIRYYDQQAPSIFEAGSLVRPGLAGLGQALFPWNRDPLFEGDGPWLGRFLAEPLGLQAPWMGALLLLPPLFLAFFVIGRLRAPLFVLSLVVLACVVPVGLLYAEQPTNFVARITYLPMVPVAAAWALACVGLASRPGWNRVGLVCAALTVLGWVDGERHVARTETLAAREQAQVRRLVGEVVAEHGALGTDTELAFLVIRPPSGFGDIPALGDLLPRAFLPPFHEAPGHALHVFPDLDGLLDHVAELELASKSVIGLGPELDATGRPLPADPDLTGEENRARRALRRLTELRVGRGSVSAVGLSRPDLDEPLWRFAQPFAVHAVPGFELRFAPGAVSGRLVLTTVEGGTLAIPLHAEVGADPLDLGFPPAVEFVFGPALERIVWEGEGELKDLRLVDRLPEVEPLEPAPGTGFQAEPERLPLPRFRLRLPPGRHRPRFARLELRFVDQGDPVPVFADSVLAPEGDEFQLTPLALHQLVTVPPADPPHPATPWDELSRASILPELSSGRLRRAGFQWRVILYHAGGAPAARSPFRKAHFLPAPPP